MHAIHPSGQSGLLVALPRRRPVEHDKHTHTHTEVRTHFPGPQPRQSRAAHDQELLIVGCRRPTRRGAGRRNVVHMGRHNQWHQRVDTPEVVGGSGTTGGGGGGCHRRREGQRAI